MKIGINASFIRKPNTGIAQVTIGFLKRLIASNPKDIDFILYLEEDLPKGFKLPKNFQKRIFLPLWKRDDLIRKIWWEGHMLPKAVKKDGCDIFFSLYQCPTSIESARHIMLVHDIVPKLYPAYLDNSRKKYYQKLTEVAIKGTDKILTVSKRTEKDLIQHLDIPADKISVSYIDVDEVYKKRPAGENIAKVLKKYKLKPGYILAGGGMEIRKNVESVIRAYKFIKDKKFVPDLPPLIIYGRLLPGNSLALDAEKLVRELNLTKQIKLLGTVPQKDMPAIFSESTMFVYPSHYEGFGMPPLEAMNLGVPTIISKKASLPEVGGDGVLYCQDDDIYDIALVMKNVMTNRDLRENLKVRAKMQTEKFSWDRFVEKFLNIAENLK